MIKKISVSLVSVLLSLVLFTTVVCAAWEFYFPTNIQDTSAASRSYYPVILGYNGQTFIDAGKINANGLDTNMQIATTDIPYMISTTNILAVVPTLPITGLVTTRFYTGYDPVQTGFPIIVGDDGYITVSDDADLELGNAFTIEHDGYVDTDSGTDKNLVYKDSAFISYIPSDGNIRSGLLGTYKSPTSDNDPDAGWTLDANAYDGNTATYAKTSAAGSSWGTFLYLIRDPVLCDSVRHFSNLAPTEFNEIDIDVYYDAEWHDVYSGAFADDVWETKSLGGVYSVTQARIRYYNVNAGARADKDTIAEFDFIGGEYVDAAVVSGEHTVKTILSGGTLSLTIDAEAPVTTPCADSVPDNANDYILMENMSIPYMNYIKITTAIGGVSEKLWYQPNTMVVGTDFDGTADAGSSDVKIIDAELTQADDYWNLARLTIVTTTDGLAPEGETAVITDFIALTDELQFAALTAAIDAGDTYTIDFGTLVDRDAGDEDGRITWGVNSDITLTYGAMGTYESTDAVASSEAGYVMSEVTLPSSWFASGGSVSNLPFYDSFSTVATSIGMPVQNIYFWAIIGLAFGVALFIVLFTKSALLGVGAMTIVFFIGSSQSIIPMWIPFVLVIVDIGIMYLYRQVSY